MLTPELINSWQLSDDEVKYVTKQQGTFAPIVGRQTRSRANLAKSYHSNSTDEEQRVWSEFGSVIWALPILAGFSACTIEAFEYPVALAIRLEK